MSKEIFDDLMDNELNFNRLDFSIEENDESKFIYVPDKIMLKDYFLKLQYEEGMMRINSYGEHPQNKGIFESVSTKLDEGDIGHISIFGEEGEESGYWMAKNRVEYME
jgi:hypothetical protein